MYNKILETQNILKIEKKNIGKTLIYTSKTIKIPIKTIIIDVELSEFFDINKGEFRKGYRYKLQNGKKIFWSHNYEIDFEKYRKIL